jgi:hypothetical protein
MDNLHKILKAIRKINPNAVMTVAGDDIDTCSITWLEDTTPISKEDIKTQMPIVEQEALDAETATANKKASGKQKLKDLGLDDDEINALIGV